jgi:hypothetical protein
VPAPAPPVIGPRPDPRAQPEAPLAGGALTPDVTAARGQVAAPFADGRAAPLERAGIPDAVAAMDPELLEAMRRREAFIASLRGGADGLSRNDFATQQQGAEGGLEELVRIRGTDSRPGAGRVSPDGPAAEGHIMATQMLPQGPGQDMASGEHFSFYPATGAEKDARTAAGTPTAPVRLGTGQPPFAESPLLDVSARPGMLASESEDKYLHGPPDENGVRQAKRQDFDHAFDPAFLDPKTFARLTREAHEREAELASPEGGPALRAIEQRQIETMARGNPDLIPDMLPQSLEEQVRTDARAELAREHEFRLAGVPLDQERQADERGKPTTMGRAEGTSQHDPRREDFQPPGAAGPEGTIQAQNCGTELLGIMRQMGVITPQDLVMLGGDKNGRFKPGNDLTPQQLYEHLRWKEHEFMQERRRQAQQQQAQGPAPPAGA